ncbi:MAG TPA: hypothetical protein VK826_05385 [Bacteroidia bacterium]|nr:hypothetical protein [Bacteroidia bacterium]
MKNILLLAAFIAVTTAIHAQDTLRDSLRFRTRNSVQLELGGHGLFYSLNYERVFINGRRFKTSVQAGIAYYPPPTGIRELWIPVSLNEIFSFNKHHIELGAGCLIINEPGLSILGETPRRRTQTLLIARLGYRYQKPDGRFILRAGFTPTIEYYPEHKSYFYPLGGVSLGYAF